MTVARYSTFACSLTSAFSSPQQTHTATAKFLCNASNPAFAVRSMSTRDIIVFLSTYPPPTPPQKGRGTLQHKTFSHMRWLGEEGGNGKSAYKCLGCLDFSRARQIGFMQQRESRAFVEKEADEPMRMSENELNTTEILTCCVASYFRWGLCLLTVSSILYVKSGWHDSKSFLAPWLTPCHLLKMRIVTVILTRPLCWPLSWQLGACRLLSWVADCITTSILFLENVLGMSTCCF